MIASILKLLKIFSEVIVISKCAPLARTEKQAFIKGGPTEKFIQNKSSCPEI